MEFLFTRYDLISMNYPMDSYKSELSDLASFHFLVIKQSRPLPAISIALGHQVRKLGLIPVTKVEYVLSYQIR
jgi:hypothetical protein